jgi:phospho-N-acetylmuramoyl-pentapeptide-transferase
VFPDLVYPLVRFFTPLNIFQYITFRSAYAAVTSLLICFVFGPGIIAALKRRKAREEIREEGPESHQVKSGTPTMGGVLIIMAIVVSTVLWQSWNSRYTWIVLMATLGFGAIGFVDDWLKIFRANHQGITARTKLIGQFVVAMAIATVLYLTQNEFTTLLYLPMVKTPLLDMGLLYIPFAMLLLVGTSNAVNLTDGLDGLATGLVLMVALTFGALAYVSGRFDFAEYLQIPFIPGAGELTIFAFAVVGACIGFLWFNSHPAEVMMGDTGSLSLGGLMGALALMLKKEILLIVVGGVFVIEVFSVIIQVLHYKRTKKRVFLMAPLHHHFELKGWAESKVVTRFWILGGLFAILSLSTLKIR